MFQGLFLLSAAFSGPDRLAFGVSLRAEGPEPPDFAAPPADVPPPGAGCRGNNRTGVPHDALCQSRTGLPEASAQLVPPPVFPGDHFVFVTVGGLGVPSYE